MNSPLAKTQKFTYQCLAMATVVCGLEEGILLSNRDTFVDNMELKAVQLEIDIEVTAYVSHWQGWGLPP